MKSRRAVAGSLSALLVVSLLPTAALAGGTLKASAKKEGDRPRRVVINQAADPNCVKANTGPDGKTKKIGSENAIVSKDKEVMNVIVYVKDGLGDKKFDAPGDKATIDQHGCMYSPHVLTVQTGQPVIVKNSDDTLHNIHSFAKKQRAFNFAQPQKGMENEVDFSREEFVMVKCDVHPWMSAYVGVFDHPYHAVTGKDGMASIADLPAGEYTIGAWHEEFGETEQKVTVKDGEEATVEFTFE